MKHLIKRILRTVLDLSIIVQLAFMPYYGYATLDPESVIKSSLQEIQNRMAPEDFEKDQTLIDLSIAIETGQVKEYLQQNPVVAEEVDYFLLSNQKVEAVEHHFDAEKKEIVESIAQTLHLNKYNNHPVEVAFKEVQVHYNEESQTLVFEGLSEGAVRLRQFIPNMNIVDYIHDGDTLALLDTKKGLLLVDMIFARSYLGMAPVPVAQIPVPVLKTLSELESDTSQWTRQNISLEFIHRGAHPPDILVKEVRQKMDKNFEGQDMVFAGDLMLSHTDQKGQKHLLQFLKREEMQGWLNLNYQMLDIMMKVVAPHLMGKTDLNMLEKELENVKEKDPKALLDHILSSLFNKQALYKLGLASEGIQKRVQHLSSEMSPRDAFLFNEWRESFQKIHSHLKQQGRITGGDKPPALSTAEVAGLLKKEETSPEHKKNTGQQSPERKKIRAKALQIIAHITDKIKNPGRMVTGYPVSTSIGAGLLASGFVFPELWITLFYKITSVFNHLGYGGDFALYKMTSIPHFLTTLVLFPGIVILSAWLFNPIMRGLEKKMPAKFSIRNKVYHPKGALRDVLNKWESANVLKKFLGAGMKMVALFINPLWNYVAYSVGQRHFMASLQKGINPFQTIDPKSDIGQIVGIKKPVRLGLNKPYWSKGPQFDRQRQLQNVALAKQNRIKSLAWQMAVLAVAGKEEVTPDQIIMYGVTGVNFEDLKKVHNDLTLRMEMLYTLKNLEKEIKSLNEVDIRKALSELDPEMLVRYYERAKETAQKAKAQPYFFKKTRAFWNTGSIGWLRNRLRAQSIAGFNQAEVRLLNQVPTDFVAGRSFRDFVPDHFLVVLMPMLMTNRANLSAEHIYQMAINENFLSYSGRPHIYDVWRNAYEWLFISGAGNAMAYTNKTKVLENLQAGHTSFYGTQEQYTDPIKARSISELTYFKNQGKGIVPGSAEEDPGRMRVGNIWLKHTKAMLRSIQMGIIFALAVRSGIVGQSVSEALSAYVLIFMAQFWFLGWPWMIIHAGDLLNTKEIAENKQKMESLQLKLSHVARGLYQDKEAWSADFKSAVEELKNLYPDKAWRRLTKDLPDLSSAKDMESVRKAGEQYIKILVESPPLPNRPNERTNFLWTLIFGSILTTYLGVELFIWTFDANKLSTQNLLEWTGINIALLSFFYFFYKKSLKEHVTDFKTGKVRKARMEKIKQELKDWKQAVDSLKKPEESWRHYFYEGILNLKSSVHRQCQKVFTKK